MSPLYHVVIFIIFAAILFFIFYPLYYSRRFGKGKQKLSGIKFVLLNIFLSLIAFAISRYDSSQYNYPYKWADIARLISLVAFIYAIVAVNTNIKKAINLQPSNLKKIIAAAILMTLCLIFSISFNHWLNSKYLNENSKGLKAIESGNYIQAISMMKSSLPYTTDKNTKIQALKNLGYAYSAANQNDSALLVFKNAQSIIVKNSFDYYLLTGEIQYKQGNPSEALSSFQIAYKMNPYNYQVKSSGSSDFCMGTPHMLC